MPAEGRFDHVRNVVELLPADGPRFDHSDGECEALSDLLILGVLGTVGVIGVVIYGVTEILDQLPKLFAAWHRARHAWREAPRAETREDPQDAAP